MRVNALAEQKASQHVNSLQLKGNRADGNHTCLLYTSGTSFIVTLDENEIYPDALRGDENASAKLQGNDTEMCIRDSFSIALSTYSLSSTSMIVWNKSFAALISFVNSRWRTGICQLSITGGMGRIILIKLFEIPLALFYKNGIIKPLKGVAGGFPR